jgi:uncharacterized DUF497 family protein
MKFEWDPAKELANRIKHGIGFAGAATVFSDPLHFAKLDGYDSGEERWQAIGMNEDGLVLLVVHCHRDDDGGEIIRIISARRTTRTERREYER